MNFRKPSREQLASGLRLAMLMAVAFPPAGALLTYLAVFLVNRPVANEELAIRLVVNFFKVMLLLAPMFFFIGASRRRSN